MTILGGIPSTTDMPKAVTTSPTPGATVSLAVSNNLDIQISSWTAGENETVNISGSHPAGKILIIVITNDGTLFRVITLGTGFVGAGVMTGVVNKVSTAMFVSNGTNFIEISRTVAI